MRCINYYSLKIDSEKEKLCLGRANYYGILSKHIFSTEILYFQLNYYFAYIRFQKSLLYYFNPNGTITYLKSLRIICEETKVSKSVTKLAGPKLKGKPKETEVSTAVVMQPCSPGQSTRKSPQKRKRKFSQKNQIQNSGILDQQKQLHDDVDDDTTFDTFVPIFTSFF